MAKERCLETGPSMQDNLSGRAPFCYYIFWTVGAVALSINLFFSIRHIRAIMVDGNVIRKKLDSIFIPQVHRMFLIVCAMPCVVSCCSYMNLLSPQTIYFYQFISYLYQAFAVYQFGQLVIIYLGGYTFLMERLRKVGVVQPFIEPPILCCCHKCCPAKVLTKGQFILLYNLIMQYVVLLPGLMFAKLLTTVKGDSALDQVFNLAIATSNQLAFSALGGLCKVCKDLLAEYNIVKKFNVVQFSVVLSVLPGVFLTYIPVGKFNGLHYGAQVIKEAYGNFLACIFNSIFAVMITRVFPVSECLVILKRITKQAEEDFQRFKEQQSKLHGENVEPEEAGVTSVPEETKSTTGNTPLDTALEIGGQNN